MTPSAGRISGIDVIEHEFPLSIVTPGVDPGVHAAPGLDRRVKPGDDDRSAA
jgi:hypothetical protein